MRTTIEIFVVIFSILYFLLAFYEIYIQRWKLFLHNLYCNPVKILFLFSNSCVLFCLIARLICNNKVEDVLTVLAITAMSAYFLYFLRGFHRICIYVYIFHFIIKNIFTRFIFIYAIFLMGFSQCKYTLLTMIPN